MLINKTGQQFGNLHVSDALVNLIANQVKIIDYGPEQAFQQVEQEFVAWNTVLAEEMSQYAEISSEVEYVYGGDGVLEMMESDELNIGIPQKVLEGLVVSAPLRRATINTGWSQDFLSTNSVDTLQGQVAAMKTGDLQRVERNLRGAIYNNVSKPVYVDGADNPAAWRDRLVVPQVLRPTFPFLNADGGPVPIGPSGEAFDPTTHNHYMADDWTGGSAGSHNAALLALVSNVVEHKVSGTLQIQINFNDEALVRACPDFVKSFEEGVVIAITETYAAGERLNPTNYNNRKIGTFHGFDVWVKPWALHGYIIAMAFGSGQRRPLIWRVRKDGLYSGLSIMMQNKDYPFYSEKVGRDGGCGVWFRDHAAVLDITGNDDVYTLPAAQYLQ